MKQNGIITIIILLIFLYFIIDNFNPTIDAVITYVNPDDPIWIKEKEKYANKDTTETINSRKNWRWQNSNEIKYCLLGIQKHAPFFRKIFLVVSGVSQTPDLSYLDETTKNKITVVTHSEFYKDQGHLPTYNSMSIEANLFRIKDLSEYFVYFNDDTFINKPVTKYDFVRNGRIVIRPEILVSPKGRPNDSDSGFFSAWKNTNKMLDTKFGSSERLVIKHTPQIQVKRAHYRLSELFPDEFEKTSRSKFRSIECNLINAGLAEYYSLNNGLGKVYPDDLKDIQIFINNGSNIDYIINYLKSNDFTFINLQNSNTNPDFSLKNLLERLFDN